MSESCTSGKPAAAQDKEKKYTVKYEGNSSKRWDGREIVLDGNWLETLYQPSELVPGKIFSLPWMTKGGTQHWSAVVVEENGKFMELCIHIRTL